MIARIAITKVMIKIIMRVVLICRKIFRDDLIYTNKNLKKKKDIYTMCIN